MLEPEEMHKLGLSTPHTSHCSPTGEILISTMGKPNGDALGDLLCIDSQTLEVKGTWTKGEEKAKFGYDFWYQPDHDALVSTEWGVPRFFKGGWDPSHGKDPGESLLPRGSTAFFLLFLTKCLYIFFFFVPDRAQLSTGGVWTFTRGKIKNWFKR